MLTADNLDVLPDSIVRLYSEYEDSIIFDIARRLSTLAFDSAAWQVQRLSESGMLYEEILKKLAELTGKSEAELNKIFVKAGVKSIAFDDAVYIKAGLNPLPLNMSPAMAEVLAAGLRKTMGVMRNLVQTTAIAGQNAFIDASDLAYMQVSTGAMSYTQAIKEAILSVADKGVKVVNYASGRQDQLDVAARRAVLTGVSQTVGELQMKRAEQLGQDLVQTTAHAGARPTHVVWQGLVFSRSGTSEKYPPFSETGYGEIDGLMGINCRHSFYPFFDGISKNAYDEATRNELANVTVTYNGKQITQYEASQIQRGIERKIRFYKRRVGALEAAGLDSAEDLSKVREWQARMRDLIKQTGLNRQSVREQI